MSASIGNNQRRSFAWGVTALAGCLLVASCGGTTEVASSTLPATTDSAVTTAAPPVTTAPTTVPATSSPPVTTAPATTVAPTTVPATTAPPVTTAPPTTTPPGTAPVDTAPKPATAYVTADDQLLEVDVATGATVRVLDEFFSGDGVFRGGLRLSPDRSVIWYSEGYEDSWYSCEASTGSWGSVDAATGAIDVLGSGSGVEPSADGAFVSYVTSGLCLPDPDNPEFFVLTPGDRVVVRELATGQEREFVTDTPPADYAAPPGAVRGASFSPSGVLLVLTGDGRLFGVDIEGSSVIQDHPVVAPEVPGDPVSAVAGGLLTVDFGDEGSSDLSVIDAESGLPTLLASSGAYMAVGVSAGDHIVVSSFEPVTVAPGADVSVLELPGQPFVFDLDW